jgi:hypothetical protein
MILSTQPPKRDPDFRKTLEFNFPLSPHAAEPRDLAYKVLFLAFDEFSYVIGSEFVGDGGFNSK